MYEEIKIDGTMLNLKRNIPFRIAWINDLHVGAQQALWPMVWKTKLGQEIRASDGQKAILDYFLNRFAMECKENKINIVAIVGDLITGQNRKELGAYTMTTELQEQIGACTSLIGDFCDTVESVEEVWIWKGTPYHLSLDTSIEEQITNKLQARGIKTRFMGEFSILNLSYGNNEKTMFVTHPASSAVMYPEQAMGRDMMTWQESVANGKLPKVDMIIRAHKHNFIEVHKAAIRALQLPCWQFLVPYDGALKNFSRYQPDVGGVIMMFDEKMRTTVWHFIYPNIIEPQRFLGVNIGEVTSERKRERTDALSIFLKDRKL